MKRLIPALLFFLVGASACFAAESKPLTAQDYFGRAEARYREIEDWKKSKNWEAVYDKGPEYNKLLADDLNKAEPLAKGDAPMLFKIKYLRWQNLRDDSPDRAFGMFSDVVAAAAEAAKSKEALPLIKKAADGLKAPEEKNSSRRLYEVYVKAVISSASGPAELKEKAEAFLAEGNLYLAKMLYEAYLKTEAADAVARAKKMIEVADKFAHPGDRDGLDPVYAEGLYKKAFDLAGDAAFSEASLYRRAFNLERMKDYEGALAQYKKLTMTPEIYFRCGVLTAYGLKDAPAGSAYLAKLIEAFPQDALAAAADYQLGVLAQARKENDKAKSFYEAVLAATKDKETELTSMARDRLKEMEEGKEMAYGLKLFLEGTFPGTDERRAASMSLNVDVTGAPAKGPNAAPVRFTVTASNAQTGCLVPDYSYEWSGDMGGATNIPNSAQITTAYPSSGLKVVGSAVVGPAGLEGVGFDIVQVGSDSGK